MRTYRQPTQADFRNPLRGLTREAIQIRQRIMLHAIQWYGLCAAQWVDISKDPPGANERAALLFLVFDLFPSAPPTRISP